MSSNLQNSIWPNADGTLGQIKVQIPDGVTTSWPKGDALVGNFVYNKGKLVGLVDTKALIANDSKSTTFPYEYVNISLPSIAEGEMTYNYDQCAYFILNGEVLQENFKYKGCKTVADIIALDSLYLINDIVNGVWTESLADLTDGTSMFEDWDTLESFTSKLTSLTNGSNMFYGCTNLTSFTADLSSLTNGGGMFGGNYWNSCNLNTTSVQHIANTINTYNGSISIGIGNSTPNEQEKAAFNKMVAKGWTVRVNGSTYTPTSPAAITILDENGEETVTPIPFWAKPVPSDEQNAQYIDSEGNFYNILGAQFIYGDDLSTYGMFTCVEDAAANMRLTKIEK